MNKNRMKLIAGIVVVSVCACTAAAWGAVQQNRYNSCLDEGAAAILDGDYSKAIDCYQDAVDIKKNKPEGYKGVIVSDALSGKFENAKTALAQLKKVDSEQDYADVEEILTSGGVPDNLVDFHTSKDSKAKSQGNVIENIAWKNYVAEFEERYSGESGMCVKAIDLDGSGTPDFILTMIPGSEENGYVATNEVAHYNGGQIVLYRNEITYQGCILNYYVVADDSFTEVGSFDDAIDREHAALFTCRDGEFVMEEETLSNTNDADFISKFKTPVDRDTKLVKECTVCVTDMPEYYTNISEAKAYLAKSGIEIQ